jgi:membrane protease YdiL (CAAX protease family)
VAARGPTRRGRPARATGGAVLPVPAGVLNEAGTSRRPVRWGLGDVAVGLVPFALAALTLLGGDGEDVDPTIGSLVANSLLIWLFLIGVPVFATGRKGNGVVTDLALRFRWPADAGAFVIGVVLQAVVVWALYVPIFWFSDVDGDDVSNEARELVDSASGFGILVLVLVVCVGAPFAEELFFRGLFLRSAERRWGTGAALAVTTVVFGLSHLQGIQLPALLVFGFVAGLLTVRSGRLGPAIACHMGFNAWTLVQLLLIDPSS